MAVPWFASGCRLPLQLKNRSMTPPRLLIVEDEHALARALAATVEHAGGDSEIAATAALARKKLAAAGDSYAAMILDIGLPDQNGLGFLESLGDAFDLPTIIITAHGEIQNTIAARKLGVVDFFQKPLDFDAFNQSLQKVIRSRGGRRESNAPEPMDSTAYIGAARSMRPVFQQIAHCCASDEPVLIRGEIGSGKSHTARVIQTFGAGSPERAATLIAGPGTTIDELHHALDEVAGGLLIIEDVGRLDEPLQAELVREFESRSPAAFPRLIATSSDDLYQAVAAGRFRSDLFYRLQILEVRLPPLRHRMEDLPALVSFFLGQLKPGRNISVGESATNRLFAYDWPGNLRELHNTMAFALTVSSDATVIDEAHLPDHLRHRNDPGGEDQLPGPLRSEMNAWLDRVFENDEAPRFASLESSLEKALIEQLLKRYDGKLAPMAAALGANRSTLRRKLRG